MVKQIPGEVAEKLLEQAKHTGKAAKQTPKTVFQRMVGEKTDEEKEYKKEEPFDEAQGKEAGVEDVAASGTAQPAQQQVVSQTDIRRREIETERKVKRKKMQKLLHKRLFQEAEKVRKRREEEERLRKMQEEEEKKKKEEKKMEALEQKEKEEALAVRVAKRAKGAGEFGPRKPK